MTPVVLDCNVVMAAIGWSGTARLCLKLAALRRIALCVTKPILAEYEMVIPERLAEEIPGLDSRPKLLWIRAKSRILEPDSLGRQRSRDQKDDPYLACAVAAQARYIITCDNDLLSPGKPFGVEIIRPGGLIRRLE